MSKALLSALCLLIFTALATFTTACGKAGASNTAAAAGAAAQKPLPPLAKGNVDCPSNYVQDVVTLINQVRAHDGNLAPLGENDKLMLAARKRSDDMATNGVLTHDGWNVTLPQFGYVAPIEGENIALNSFSPAAVVQAWVNSPHHYANIMTGVYNETGMGCVYDSSGQIWWTQDFGAR